MSASIIMCERCKAFPAETVRQTLVLSTVNGRPYGKATPSHVCTPCADEWPSSAGERTVAQVRRRGGERA